VDLSFKIGGEAGQGVQTVGQVLAEVFARAGFHVFTHQDYESRVRGGHNFYQVRVSDQPVMSSRPAVDIVIALDRTSISVHRDELVPDGVLALDAETIGVQEGDEAFVDVPFKRLAEDEGGNPIMANIVAVGACLGMMGMETGILEDLLSERFGKKGEDVISGNIKAARAGHSYAREHCRQCRFLPAEPLGRPKVLINGLEATAMGALASGLKFYAAYPMTPSTGIMNGIAARAQQMGVVIEQAEDEIAAINMALGASFAGVRSATGTSGGGFALMAEGLSLAGMTETPVVIFESQRPGPATGLPTRTEQGDLLFILHAGHGEFPRVILAPGTPEQAILLTNKAFDLAEKYQVPVFVLLDQYLGDSQWAYDRLDGSSLIYHDYRLRGEAFAKLSAYKRHALTESGISPLAVPGDGPHVVVTDSDEHNEEGHIIEDARTRIRMMEKRLMKKLPALRAEMAPPLRYGHDAPESVMVGWGSTFGVMKEAVDALNSGGRKTAMLHFSEIYPLPDGDYLTLLQKAARAVCVEGNATGQFERLLRAETGTTFDGHVRRFDGRPFTVECIVEELDA
jgi:2-oxoglutarate ferredoxin oxidoreductase subunit alpha